MERRENEGLLSYIQSQGTAEAIKEFTVDEIMELIMNINSKKCKIKKCKIHFSEVLIEIEKL